MTDGPPSIHLHAHRGVTEAQLTDLLLGIEEEGVPVMVERFDELNPLTLAHAAAVSSRLGLGLGIALEFAVITTEKLPSDRPYIAVFLNGAGDREIGSNAARLVKRVPLRPIPQERTP